MDDVNDDDESFPLSTLLLFDFNVKVSTIRLTDLRFIMKHSDDLLSSPHFFVASEMSMCPVT